jgi:hypothetical protein
MAYQIQKLPKAHYICMNIECDNETLVELETAFKFNDAVLRHLTVKMKKAETAPSPMMKSVQREDAAKSHRAEQSAAPAAAPPLLEFRLRKEAHKGSERAVAGRKHRGARYPALYPGRHPDRQRHPAHGSQQTEAGIARQVEFEISALAAGDISGRFADAELGAVYQFKGFLARKNRNSKALVFHIIDFIAARLDTGASNGIR